jgi:DNA primase
MIPDSFIQELLSRIDIVDVVERYVPLRKGGANYSACCPFHSEKSPSFTVSPSKQFYHCFGCGAHGSAIGFVMQYSGLGFVDAVEELAGFIGLTVPKEVSPHRVAETARKAPLTEPMARAMKFYRDQLKASPKAVEYLKGRGLTGEIAARFGLGYSPDDWQGLKQVFPNYDDPALVECGLVIVNDQGRRYDRFRDRIMFPILDQRGNVIGFGGRVIGAGDPKYLNSPETPLFQKGHEVYGLPQARKTIHGEDRVIVVEGYMDVVGLAQNGVENVVATLGTAATGTNVQKLLKQASRVVFCFDRDAAGDRAAWRAMENSLEFLADNKSVEILQMSGDQDPDEFVREHGHDAFVEQLNRATKLSEFMVRELKNRTQPYTAEGRAQLIHEAKPLLQKIAAPIMRVQITKAIADLAELTQAEVEAQCELKPLARARYAPPSRGRLSARTIEHALLEIVLHKPEWSVRLPLERIDRELPEGNLLHAIADAMEHGELPRGGAGLLLEFFRGHPHEELLASMIGNLATEQVADADLEAVLNDAVDRLHSTGLKQEIDALTAKARQGGLNTEERQRLAQLLSQKGGEKPTY